MPIDFSGFDFEVEISDPSAVPDHPGMTNPWVEAIEMMDEFGIDISDRSEWRNDPVRWVEERGNAFLWSKQREIIEAVRDESRVAVHSCHSVGKTFLAATIAGWWIDSHPPGSAFVVTTAPTGAQVKALLWREINRLHIRAQLSGRVNLTEWYLDNELVAMGRKPSEYNQAAFQGVHALHVLVIMDEACGIPLPLWTAAETIASNENSRILAVGNPDIRDGQFAKVCGPASSWRTIHVGYHDTPNFTGEEVPGNLHQLLIAKNWVENRRQEWGEDSALFQSKVLGHFPKAETDTWTVVPYGMAQQCRWLDLPEDEPIEAGIDVGAGGDRTVIRERRGPKVGRSAAFVNPDPMATVGELSSRLAEWGIQRVKIDVIGIGWGIYGRLRELSSVHNPSGERLHNAEVIAVNFGAKSIQPKRFLNKRAEVWWNVGRENSRLGKWDLGTLDDSVISELTTPRYEIMDSYGKIKIEPKDQVRERLGASPDEADALLLAFHTGVSSAPVSAAGITSFARTKLLNGHSGPSGSNPFSGTKLVR